MVKIESGACDILDSVCNGAGVHSSCARVTGAACRALHADHQSHSGCSEVSHCPAGVVTLAALPFLPIFILAKSALTWPSPCFCSCRQCATHQSCITPNSNMLCRFLARRPEKIALQIGRSVNSHAKMRMLVGKCGLTGGLTSAWLSARSPSFSLFWICSLIQPTAAHKNKGKYPSLQYPSLMPVAPSPLGHKGLHAPVCAPLSYKAGILRCPDAQNGHHANEGAPALMLMRWRKRAV